MVGQQSGVYANDGQTQASEGLANTAGLQEEFFSSLPSFLLFSLTTDSLSYSYQPLALVSFLPFAHRVLSFHSRCQLHSFSCALCCPFFLYPVLFHRVCFAYPTTTDPDSTRLDRLRHDEKRKQPYPTIYSLSLLGLFRS